MKTSSLMNSHRWIGLVVLLLAIGLLPGCGLFRGGGTDVSGDQANTPPKPKEPASVLQMPGPVKPEEQKGPAALPEELNLGFAIDLGDKVMTGDLDLRVSVKSIENRTVVFQTDQGETGHLVYRLPQEIQLPLKAGQSIAIKRILRAFEVTSGYELLITSDDGILLAAGTAADEKPLEVRLGKELLLQQVDEQKPVIRQTKSETIYQVPLVLIAGNSTTRVSIGKATEFKFEGKSFVALVADSAQLVPTKEYEAVTDGRGYTLEYVVTLRADRDIPK